METRGENGLEDGLEDSEESEESRADDNEEFPAALLDDVSGIKTRFGSARLDSSFSTRFNKSKRVARQRVGCITRVRLHAGPVDPRYSDLKVVFQVSASL